MRLDPTLQNRSDSDQLDESIGSKPRSRSRSKGINGSSSRTHSLDNSTDASFLPVYKRHSEVNEFDFKVITCYYKNYCSNRYSQAFHFNMLKFDEPK